MAVVGANEWKGGFLKYRTRYNQTETFEPADMDADSYLGMNVNDTCKNREIVVINVNESRKYFLNKHNAVSSRTILTLTVHALITVIL